MSSGSKTNRKGSKTRGPKKGGNHITQSPTYDGIYGNPQLVHHFLNLMGTKCVVQVRNGKMYSGIFHTVSPELDVVLAAAHALESNSSGGNPLSEFGYPCAEKLIDELIFHIHDVVNIEILDVNLGYAEVSVKSNGDAGMESKFPSANGSDFRPLEPWDGGGDSTADAALGGLEDGLTGGSFAGTNGWTAEDMFQTNRDQYGVKSSYNPDLPEYTTPLEDDHSEEYEQRKARAERIAQEIEGSQNYIKNISLEVDESTTEEEKFSAVSRDFSKFGRGRARSRDPAREQRNPRPGYYQGPGNMPRSSGYGPAGRANAPANPAESTTSPPGQPKSFSRQSGGSQQPSLPPRMQKSNQQREAAFQREDDRATRGHMDRMQDTAPHHPGFSNQQKPPRQAGQGRPGYGKSAPPMITDYVQPPSDSAVPGQVTPQSLSRDSSSSSLTQQAPTPWKGEERMHEMMPPNAANPNMSRNFSSRGGERCRNQAVQKVHVIPRILGRPSRLASRPHQEMRYSQQPGGPGPAMRGHAMQQPVAGPYPDKVAKHPPAPGYRHVIPTPNVPQAKSYFLTPKGHSPPLPGNTSNQMMIPQTNPVHPTISPRPQRYPTVTSALPSNVSQNPPMRRSTGGISDGKNQVLKKTLSSSSSQSNHQASISKSSSTGSSNEIKQGLQDFQKNFNLQLSDSTTGAPSENKSVSTTASRSKSMDETPSSRSGVLSKPQKATIPANQAHASSIASEPSISSQRPPSQAIQAATSLVNPALAESSEATAAPRQQQASGVPLRHQVAGHPPNVWQSPDQQVATTAPPPPSINVPTPQSTTTASDVQTVCASAQYVATTMDSATQATVQTSATTAEPPSQAAAPVIEHTKTGSSSSGEPAAGADAGATKLNPNAVEFTPRSFAPKSGGSNTSRSATPVAPTPPGATYLAPGGQFIVVNPKSTMPKNQPMLSASPSDPQMHLHPTTVGHILPHAYHHPAAPLVFTQNPGTPALVHQQTYSTVEQTMMYNPQAGHHIVQPAARAIPGYAATADYTYQSAQPIHIQQQQQHPSPQHQAVAHQPQQSQPAQAGGYIAQQAQQQQAQPQQQQRPHSAHTPNAAQIPPASPATNVQQPMAVTTMGVNTAVQMHAAPPPPHGYFQLAHPASMHPAVPNSPHSSYHGMPRAPAAHYMLLQGAQQIPAPNPTGQHGYVQPAAVVSSANHAQQQYSNARPYHIQSYQQQP